MVSLSNHDIVFFGPYVCHIDRSVCVPEGEEGLLFMRDFLRKNGRSKKPGAALFESGFVGFLSYEFEAHFVYVDEVLTYNSNLNDSRYIFSNIVPKSNISREQYFEKIARIKKYLFDGDTYQVNFSQRFEVPYQKSAFELYQKLSAANPSPYQFFMEDSAGSSEFAVISNSPERLFQINNGIIQTRPIKGTVPRGKTPKEDEENIRRLLASEKEKAELAMIVDLERNDLGKICLPGTVEVDENRTVEKYSHVIHTVSNIRGVLAPELDWYDALRALFPGGSVTGCPKKRTMEIISELENFPRGIYCGSAGWIDLSGNCDFNIMIRTMWYDKKAGRIIFHSGGGIVADSDPQTEYEETLHKAAAIMDVLK